ncbi:hypothetical protein PVAP13_2KG452010 [Panicum virgatum]|uniref:Uncharacterized protein n=1 Tax=Panicum virgatum TaxID=38727 RepID=A0A8T0WI35_PANVG|nr:hypothetical protein PVAP13_2KG452010 [Panicum virgatum]
MMTTSLTETTEIDWDNEEHRRCITGCLVRGTYVLESERTKLCEANDDDTRVPLALAWWESFHFRKLCMLECECECVFCQIGGHIVDVDLGRQRFIYGAIFKYVPPGGSPRHRSALSYVVAFRGTMQRDATTVGDCNTQVLITYNQD